MNHRHRALACCLVFASALACAPARGATAPALPPIGEWDGVTESAALEGPYEDWRQCYVPFGIVSYFNHPWRGYMDTWPASKYLEVPAAHWNVPDKYAEAVCTVLEECGIRSLRIEIGWGSIDWNDELPADRSAKLASLLRILQAHRIRPMILLNAHHGVPCPVRDVPVEVAAPAAKGDRALKLKTATGVRPGYTGLQHPDYIAAYPMVTSVDADGTAHLSAGLPVDVPAGPLRLKELKYQPFQDAKRKDGTPVPEAEESFRGWLRYAAAVGRCAREALGTAGKPDADFDLEVWNEQTFGSNFLRLENYYAEKPEYAEPYVYRKTRPMRDSYCPDARLEFKQEGCYAILPMTIDYFAEPTNGFAGVRVVSGFANQWPWDNGTGLWDGQAGFSRHYYTGGWRDCSPAEPIYKRESGTIDALGNFDGKKDGKDWHTIEPESNFVPTFRCAFPEFYHSGFKTEMLSRDLIPDSRYVYFRDHGRYTHNGDFRIAEVWQTEVNYDRWPFIEQVMKDTGAKREDPRLAALDQHLAGKMLLRQYLFHAHKGLRRIYLFCLDRNPYSLGMLPPSFYDALDRANGQLSAEARALLPPEFTGLAWLKRLMETGEALDATRPLQVDRLVEHKPRLVFAGRGTPAHPHRWNRDQFAFLPFQLAADRFAIAYYVVTVDVTHAWDKGRDPLDPARYDMPDQEFDVTIGNVCGKRAKVSAYDPLTNSEKPVRIVSGTATSLVVRLQTVDYPRILQVTERRPGPLIEEPRVTADTNGVLSIAWRTNLRADSTTVTYGHDWTNRAAHRIDLARGRTQGDLRIPTGTNGVIAARISVTANGLRAAWPRWDEDPAGQVVVPGARN